MRLIRCRILFGSWSQKKQIPKCMSGRLLTGKMSKCMTDTQVMSAELKITFGVGPEGGAQGERLYELEGLTLDDLRALSEETGAQATTRPGPVGVGVGVAGPGVELILAMPVSPATSWL